VTATTKGRSIRNHRIQAAGADILRLAITALVANGFQVCAPVHDAVMLQVKTAEVPAAKAEIARIMEEATAAVIGHPIPVDFKETTWPDRYADGRGARMWERVLDLLSACEAKSLKVGSPMYSSLPSSRTRAPAPARPHVI
jgi:hypothetical protein